MLKGCWGPEGGAWQATAMEGSSGVRAEVVTDWELGRGEQGWTVCVVCTYCKDFAFTLRDEKSMEGFEQTSF